MSNKKMLLLKSSSRSDRSGGRMCAGGDPSSSETNTNKTPETTKTVNTGSPSPSVTKCLGSQSNNPRATRFNTSLLMICTIQLTMLISHYLLITNSFVLGFIAQIFVIFGSAYSYEWTQVHSRTLTRIRRAYFDESNVLETYQPRARTHGHLFIPDPPTPGPVVKFADDTEDKQPGQNHAFNNARDNHYANMYQQALKMNAEMDTLGKNACNDSADPNAELTPADPEKDKKKAEEKKEEEKKEEKKE